MNKKAVVVTTVSGLAAAAIVAGVKYAEREARLSPRDQEQIREYSEDLEQYGDDLERYGEKVERWIPRHRRGMIRLGEGLHRMGRGLSRSLDTSAR